MPSTIDSHVTMAPAPGGPKSATITVVRSGLPPRRRSPRKIPTQVSNAPQLVKSSRGDSVYVPASTLFPPSAKSNVAYKTEVSSTTDAAGKPCTTEGGGGSEQIASFTAVENTSLNLRTSKLPVNIGVPYSPNRKIGKKVVIEIADSTRRPTNKPDDLAADEADMFVDLSTLDSAKQFVRNPVVRQERHPMAFTPPSFSLGIDHTQGEPVHDPMPVAFSFLAGTVPMMVQPLANGRKAVKFADPVVQGKLFLFSTMMANLMGCTCSFHF